MSGGFFFGGGDFGCCGELSYVFGMAASLYGGEAAGILITFGFRGGGLFIHSFITRGVMLVVGN